MKRRKLIFGLIALILIGAAFWFWRMKTKRAIRPQVVTAQVERGDIKLSILVTGTVQPQNRLEIKPPIAGRIEAVEVREGQTVGKGHILAWMSSTERAALLDAARSKGTDELARWQDLYKATPLIAPLGGLLIARNVEPGQTVAPSDAVLVMSDRLIIKAQVDETDLGKIKKGLKCEVILDAYPKDVISAVVDHIAYEALTVNNVTIYEVDVLPQSPPGTMRSGMTANVSFITAQSSHTLVVPTEAVHQKNDETIVRVPSSDPKKRSSPRPVTIGLSDGKKTEILSGLSEGDTVFVQTLSLGDRAAAKNNPFAPQRPRVPRGAR